MQLERLIRIRLRPDCGLNRLPAGIPFEIKHVRPRTPQPFGACRLCTGISDYDATHVDWAEERLFTSELRRRGACGEADRIMRDLATRTWSPKTQSTIRSREQRTRHGARLSSAYCPFSCGHLSWEETTWCAVRVRSQTRYGWFPSGTAMVRLFSSGARMNPRVGSRPVCVSFVGGGHSGCRAVISYRKNSPCGQWSVANPQPSLPELGMVNPLNVRYWVISPPKECQQNVPVLSGSPHRSKTNEWIWPSGPSA